MRVAVVGASGRTGRAAVARALGGGYEVVAVVRTASTAPAASRLEVADARDADALTRAFAGCDAVISCLGQVAGSGDATILREGAVATAAAMGAAGVRRIVSVSAAGAFVADDDPLQRFVAKPIVARLFGQAFADTRRMEEVFRASPLDWTLLRPSRLISGTSSPSYRARVEAGVWWHYSTTFDTVGRAAVDALTEPAWIERAVFIAE